MNFMIDYEKTTDTQEKKAKINGTSTKVFLFMKLRTDYITFEDSEKEDEDKDEDEGDVLEEVETDEED